MCTYLNDPSPDKITLNCTPPCDVGRSGYFSPRKKEKNRVIFVCASKNILNWKWEVCTISKSDPSPDLRGVFVLVLLIHELGLFFAFLKFFSTNFRWGGQDMIFLRKEITWFRLQHRSHVIKAWKSQWSYSSDDLARAENGRDWQINSKTTI